MSDEERISNFDGECRTIRSHIIETPFGMLAIRVAELGSKSVFMCHEAKFDVHALSRDEGEILNRAVDEWTTTIGSSVVREYKPQGKNVFVVHRHKPGVVWELSTDESGNIVSEVGTFTLNEE